MKTTGDTDSNRYESAVSLIKQFLRTKKFPVSQFRILYGVKAARYDEGFDADYDSILIKYPDDYDEEFNEYSPFESRPSDAGPIAIVLLISFLKEHGFEQCWFDYLMYNGIILHLQRDPYGEHGLARREARFVELTPRAEKKLRRDLESAKRHAEAACRRTRWDVGPCNLDSVCLRLKNYRKEKIEAICDELDLSCYRWGNHIWPEFFIAGGNQGEKRTKFCEAFADHMEKLGYHASVRYRMD